MKIMVVDDEAVNSYLLETFLTGRGYEVDTSADGLEALKVLRRDSYGMIISDILMPMMDGFQLCRECKKDPALRNIPFVFYTATYTEPKDQEFALSLGAAQFIVKPMAPQEFLAIIEDVIANTKPDKAAGAPGPAEEEVYLKKYAERVVHKLEQKTLELQDANKALQESEAKYRLVVDNATDAILIVQGGQVVFVNRRAIEFCEYSADELRRRPFIEFIHPEDRQRVQEQYLLCTDPNKNQAAHPFRMIIGDGQVKWVEFHAVMIEWEGMPATLHFCTDITERILAQEVIRKNHAT
jgi:PAS domain S-box-containing protein